MRILTFVLIALGLSNSAHAISYKAEIIFPDGEEKTYRLESEETALKTPKLTWNCSVGIEKPTTTEAGTATRAKLICTKGKDAVLLPLICFDNSGLLKSETLHIKSSGEYYRISISCGP